MKNIKLLTIGILSLAVLAACSQTNKTQTSKSSSTKASSSQSGSSKASSTTSSSSSSNEQDDIETRVNELSDDGSSINFIPDADKIPEIKQLQSFHLAPASDVLVDGKSIYENLPMSTYDDVVAAFGEPSQRLDETGMIFWEKDSGRIMGIFSGDKLTAISLELTNPSSNPEPAGVTEGNSAKSTLSRLGRPKTISRSKNYTMISYNNTSEEEFSIMTKNDKIVSYNSAQSNKQLKEMIDNSLNQSKE